MSKKIKQKGGKGSVNMVESEVGSISTGQPAPLPDSPTSGDSLLNYLQHEGVNTDKLATLLTCFVVEGYQNLNYNRSSMEDTFAVIRKLDAIETVRDFALLLDANPLELLQPKIV